MSADERGRPADAAPAGGERVDDPGRGPRGRGGWTLALDTATPATVAAALGPDGAASARSVAPRPGERPAHTRLLLALVDEVLTATGGTVAGVERIVVGLGPGTFTGIRVGVATARALALAHGARVVGVPTPWALAGAARSGGDPRRPVLVVQDARRRELFLTLFADGGPARSDGGQAGAGSRGPGGSPGRGGDAADPALAGGPAPVTVPQADLAAALDRLDERPVAAVGDGAVAFAAVLRDAGIVVPEDPSAHAVDGLALLRAAAGRPGVDPVATPDAVRPVYVRDADAVPTADRR